MSRIVLHTTYFRNSSDYRNHEILNSLIANLKLNIVSHIVIYTECEIPILHPKLVTIQIYERPNFRMLSSHFHSNALNIICNSDISFTRNLDKLIHILDKPNKACFLSRRIGLSFLGKNLIFKHNIGNSQDAWAFLGKISQKDDLLKSIEKIGLGIPGNDNALVHIFRKYNYKVLNPSYAITLLHHHKSVNRNYTELDRLDVEYDFVKPSLAFKLDFLEYFVRMLNLIYYYRWFR
jgi:hypothetical protein